ncbi:ComF family protein [Shewanella surugensis]|uniref:ComF family protein n=2 Tax=Shewanella surugensis TaxID=212020 RepID=A0ABT0LGX1_9GAMM|nr:ComF family protein [Shewanella surugensis]
MCHQGIMLPDKGICPVCFEFSLYHFPVCLGCGRKMFIDTDFCGGCLLTSPLKVVAPCSYHQGLGTFVAAMKYQAQFSALDCLTDALINRIKTLESKGLLIMLQVLIPVPLHSKRLRQRGFNQAWIIANTLSKKLNIPLFTEGLSRIKNTLPQAGLSGKDRRQNLNNAFILAESLDLQRIALIDDVVTTGTTVDAIASLFQKQHIHVQVWCLARAEAPGLLN